MGGRAIERIGSGETSDKGFGLVRNRVLVPTLKFDLKSAFCWAKVMTLSAREGR